MRSRASVTLLAAVVGLAMASALAACAGAASPTPMTPAVSLPVSLVASTSFGPTDAGPFQSAGSRVVGDSSTWAATWTQIWANDSQPPALPAVDFSTSSVLVAWMGDRPTGGYQVAVTSVTETAGVVSANVTWTSPGSGCGLLQVVTSPIVVVSIPHRDPASVQFPVTQTTQNCGS